MTLGNIYIVTKMKKLTQAINLCQIKEMISEGVFKLFYISCLRLFLFWSYHEPLQRNLLLFYELFISKPGLKVNGIGNTDVFYDNFLFISRYLFLGLEVHFCYFCKKNKLWDAVIFF